MTPLYFINGTIKLVIFQMTNAVLIFAAHLLSIQLCFVSAAQSYEGYKLLRFPTKSVVWLENVEAEGFHLNQRDEPKRPLIDIWAEPNKLRPYADVMVAPEFLDSFMIMLKNHGINSVQILQRNVQREIDRQKRELLINRYRGERSVTDIDARNRASRFNLLQYHRYDEILQYLRDLTVKYPHLVGMINITRTFEGRDLMGIKVGTRAAFKPAVFIDAGVHAREWIAPAVALYVASKLASRYGHDKDITRMVDKFDWYFVPVANPDGYEYSMTTDRLWRKTRSRNMTINKWCVGADANRNWGYRWGEAGANRSPCSNIYAGASPFSEVEVAGIRDFITWQIPDLKIYVSLHSYGQLFLAPWGYTSDKPDNYYDQKMAAKFAVEAIKNRTGAEYSYGTISELMYPASGTSIDYMQSKGVPYIYGIELRPEDIDNNFGFTIPPRYIEPTGNAGFSIFFLQ
uniref:Peptidase M14 carboxypeptidase A domain-containing protein n=1 Tax=Ascaris lumbricoides TaxID=6252 RepID=A0A9J2PMH2_ASCLU